VVARRRRRGEEAALELASRGFVGATIGLKGEIFGPGKTQVGVAK
jgi:hypothetical protein